MVLKETKPSFRILLVTVLACGSVLHLSKLCISVVVESHSFAG